ncbi:helix-turn-helix domain-containing protein [Pseudidiomarina marina]|jgi:Helix-turn-helix.|uniref:XRE family transcriptional regulator n=1 Tax=Pseudidiomarina marina TaxID=502366 RepID=A0A432YL50_9GAMM|nr:helix-turn-helix transcriptional regulator [Pseudidiomarina marina]PHR65487.1 MAG: transcriptional regulator [Idiomarina sp.]RUO61711.1 XRE family transcriptional regulator [Pseudidiomarina marina]
MNKPETNRFELKAELMQQMLRGEITMGEVGRRIRTEGLRMSQEEVCKLLGLSRQVVSDIENNAGNPRLDSLQKYFKLMGFEIALLPRQRSELK